MSFSSEVKSEIIKKEREDSYAFLAFSYGLFLFSSAFSLSSMFIKTENEVVAQQYAQCAEKLAQVKLNEKKSKGGICTYSVETAQERKKILNAFSLTGNELSLRINRANIENDLYFSDFLAGVFLACGTAADPKKDYHLEFSVSFKRLCRDLVGIINEIDIGEMLEPKFTLRKYDYIVYLKGSEKIEDILVFMGAQNSAFGLMNTKVEKDVRNRANRILNCDGANLDKTVKAGIKEAQAIKKIQKKAGFDAIPEELRELAIIRMENPEMSLNEITECIPEKISRSGVYHRLKRLEKIAGDL